MVVIHSAAQEEVVTHSEAQEVVIPLADLVEVTHLSELPVVVTHHMADHPEVDSHQKVALVTVEISEADMVAAVLVALAVEVTVVVALADMDGRRKHVILSKFNALPKKKPFLLKPLHT